MNSTRRISIVAQIVLLTLFSAFSIFAAAGDIDTAFAPSAYNTLVGSGRTIAVQSDGKVLIGGGFVVINNIARVGIARLNTDGSVDTSFYPVDLIGDVKAIAIQPDGKIVIGGGFQVVNSSRKFIVRLNSDGSLDTTFADISSGFNTNDNPTYVNNIRIAADGKILFSGQFNFGNGSIIPRLNPDGTPDTGFHLPGFGGTVLDFDVQPDGKVVLTGGDVGRYNSNGSIDNTFTVAQTGGTTKVRVLPSGKILIGGGFNSVNGIQQGRLARLNSDGSLDITFNVNGIGASNIINDIFVAPDGKIFIGGDFSQYNGVPRNKLAKLNADGTLDTSFVYTPPSQSTFIGEIDGGIGGQIYVTGTATGSATDSVGRLNADGSIDSSFTPAKAGGGGIVRDIVRQPDGKYIIAGLFTVVNGIPKTNIARLNPDGSVDTTFHSTVFTVNSPLAKVALQADGKILVAGSFIPGIVRLNSDGTRDTSFSVSLNSLGYDIDVLADGKILLNGYYRFLTNGSPDPSWTPPSSNGVGLSAVIQPDGKVLLAGTFTQLGSSIRGRIARLNTDGTLDTSFNPPAGANSTVNEIDLQSDGKVVLGGLFTSLNGDTTKHYLARLNSDGTLDAAFNPDANLALNAVKLQPDGKILIGGTFYLVNGVARSRYARLNSDGSVDSSFVSTTGANGTVWRINLQPDGKILIVGDFTRINGVSRVGVVRMLNDLSPLRALFDYDGDGKADVSVFRPSTSRWYEYLSSNASTPEQAFGLSGDVIAPADYDGDGKTDIAVFRPSTGDWWYQSSINNSQASVHWGTTGDIPVPTDFDGDNKADFVVFRPSDSVWYRFGSTGQISIQQFGLAGDKPISGDFDGDGKGDIAIFRPSTGDWWWQSSLDGAQRATHWGISTDVPAPADYDGDGKTDFAVYRPSTGIWYIFNSGDFSFTILQFGLAEDKPVSADYDGDGKADIAVFRPSTGVWYFMRSSQGFLAMQFGVMNDIPTPNAFVP
ncbi:MAG: FG-GAP-like repeat-containing protein [Pyrinomonadaceae bacterium]